MARAKWRECRACEGYGRELGPPNQLGSRSPLHDALPCAVCGGEGRIYLDVAKPPPPPQGQLIAGRPAAGPEAAFFGAEVPGVRLVSRDDRPFCVGGVKVNHARGFGASGLVLEVLLAHPEGWTNIDLARQVAGTYADEHGLTWESFNPTRSLAGKKRKCRDHNPASKSYGQDKMLVASTWAFPLQLDSLVARRPELAGLGPYSLVERFQPWGSELTRQKLGILTTPLRRNPGGHGPPPDEPVSRRRNPAFSLEEGALGIWPVQQQIEHFGLVVWMRPEDFLRAAAPLQVPRTRTMAHLRDEGQGTKWAPPVLTVVPSPYGYQVRGHEGRHRSTRAVEEGQPLVPVCIFGRDSGSRASSWSIERILKLRWLCPEIAWLRGQHEEHIEVPFGAFWWKGWLYAVSEDGTEATKVEQVPAADVVAATARGPRP